MAAIDELNTPSFSLDLADACLWRGKQRISLTPKDFAVLHCLADRPGQLVRHEEMFKAVWPGVVVSHGVLKVCMRRIRQALGDLAASPRFIETVHRRGYRLLTPVVLTPTPVDGEALARE
jgi:DNA-binding winged helix-turn-helix (wHTH) protein